jgi:branched-chain amino acid transport system substrate-binding protein
MTGEQARWGYENLNLTQAKLDALGFKGVLRPISTSCQDHMGALGPHPHLGRQQVGVQQRLVPGR